MQLLWHRNGGGVLMEETLCAKCFHSTVCAAEDEGMVGCMFFVDMNDIFIRSAQCKDCPKCNREDEK